MSDCQLFDLVNGVVKDYMPPHGIIFDCNPVTDDIFREFMIRYGQPKSLWETRRLFEFGVSFLEVCRATRDAHLETIKAEAIHANGT